MNKPYVISFTATGSVTFYVRANSKEEAIEKATERFGGSSITLCWSCSGHLDEPVVEAIPYNAEESNEEEYSERMKKGWDDADYQEEDRAE